MLLLLMGGIGGTWSVGVGIRRNLTSVRALGTRWATKILVGELVYKAVCSSIVILLLLWLLCLIWLRSVALLGVQVGLLLLDGRGVGVVCKVALVGEATVHAGLCGAPYLLLSLRIRKGLREGRGGGGIGAALVSAEVLDSLETKVELQSVGLLLVVVGIHACYC